MSSTRAVARRFAGVLVVLTVAGCAATSSGSPAPAPAGASGSSGSSHSGAASTPPPGPAPAALRQGERLLTLRLPSPYTPAAPTAPGTDDYRCFLLDPKLVAPTEITGLTILPGNPKVVHHVILFRVPPAQVARAKALDDSTPGQGWTCFGGTGLENLASGADDVPWLGAWAPGGGEQVLPTDLGLPMAAGSRVIMQVHYNLLAGRAPDQSAVRLRVATDDGRRKSLQTMLLPAPVELPCRPAAHGPLCVRSAALDDVVQRFGLMAGGAADALHLLCPGNSAGPTQSCTRTVTQPGTIRAVAGHMHLLGRSISIVLNRGTARARTVLNIPVWDFDNQASRPVRPAVVVHPGDTLTVSCTHDQSLRDRLPAFAGRPERYVLWGEGTTDEMCLGIVLLTRP